MLILIWLAISAEIALVLWTPLRGWLEIPEPRTRGTRQRHMELADHDLELVDQALEPLEP